jgi:hypothetical protein
MKSIDLFPLIEPTIKKLKVDYAIGGANAMSSAGYTRETEDLDVFFKYTDAPAVLRGLRASGVTFATIADPYHYAIIPSAKNPDRRIDLLFTSEELEMDAVEFPTTVKALVKGKKKDVEMFPPVLIVAAKIRSDRKKDHDDVRRMYERGVFDPKEVIAILRGYGERAPSKRLHAILSGERIED